MTLISRSTKETASLGETLGRAAVAGDVIGLTGPLGTGKSVFVRGLAKGLQVPDSYIPSPTFTFMQAYTGRLPLYHIDLYRFSENTQQTVIEQIASIGIGDYLFGEMGLHGVCAIEWADLIEEILPSPRLMIQMDIQEDNRRITFCAKEEGIRLRLQSLRQYLGDVAL